MIQALDVPSGNQVPDARKPDARILWNIIDEHLDEAAFLLEQWERAQRSPSHTLETLSQTLEPRLEAHLDGLLVGGEPVASERLFPALEGAYPGREIVSALVLLNGTSWHSARVLAAICEAKGETRSALLRALQLSSAEGLEPLLLERFHRAKAAEEKALWLDLLVTRGLDPGPSLESWMVTDALSSLECVMAALRAGARFGRQETHMLIDPALDFPQKAVVETAVRAGLYTGSGRAWQRCLTLAASEGTEHLEWKELVALLGTPQDHTLLYPGLKDPGTRLQTLWILGFTGTVQSGDLCLPYLLEGDERTAKQAAESLAWIGGFDLQEDNFQLPPQASQEDSLPPLEQDDLDADLSTDGIDDLPLPNRDTIAKWWKEHRDQLARSPVLLRGQNLTLNVLFQTLETAPLWRRHGLAKALAIRSGGRHHFTLDAFSQRQIQELARGRHSAKRT